MAIYAKGFDATVWKNEMQLCIVEGGIGSVNDRVMVGTEEREIFHRVGSAPGAVPDVVRFGRWDIVYGRAVEPAELAPAGVKAV